MLNISQSVVVDNSGDNDSPIIGPRSGHTTAPAQPVTLRNRRPGARLARPCREDARCAVPSVQVRATCAARFGIYPPFREISGPAVTRPAPAAPRAVAPGSHLPAQEDDQADDERGANYQRRSKRREILPHGTVLPATHRGRCPRWACIVSCVLPDHTDAHFTDPVRAATACACCLACWALPAPGRETRPRPRHRNAIAPSTPRRPREYR
jgi:hypothetical protein